MTISRSNFFSSLTPRAVKGITTAYFLRNRNRPEAQEKFILSHIEEHTATAFGREHNFKNIHSITEFQKNIPLHHYETLYPRIERCLKAEKDVLIRGKVDRFATSSGTTGVSKYIPVTRASLKKNHYRAGMRLMMHYAKNNPSTRMRKGQGLVIGGGFSSNPFTNAKNVGFISAILQKHSPLLAKMMKQPKSKISYLGDRQHKIEKMLRVTSKKNITSISGQPSRCSRYLERLKEYTGKDNILQVWPNFELVIRGGMSLTLYKELFHSLFPGKEVNYYQVYNASEGFFAAQHENDRDDMLLMVEHAVFYEFLPLEQYMKGDYTNCLTLNDVKINSPYVIIVTNNAGLRRYVLGDVIQFTGTQPHTIKITGRTKYCLDVAGECTPSQPIDEAVCEAAAQCGGVLTDYTIGPAAIQSGEKGSYELLIERATPPQCDESHFSNAFDTLLCAKRSYYHDERHDTHMLALPHVRFLSKGSFYQWLEQRGKLGGQHKVPKISATRDILEELTEK